MKYSNDVNSYPEKSKEISLSTVMDDLLQGHISSGFRFTLKHIFVISLCQECAWFIELPLKIHVTERSKYTQETFRTGTFHHIIRLMLTKTRGPKLTSVSIQRHTRAMLTNFGGS